MNEQARGSHQQWDELVAAHALHALEPDEELRLLDHLDGCAACRARVDEFALVAAQLGSVADEDTQPPSWESIRSRIVPSPGDQAADAAPPPAPVVRLRRRFTTRMLAAAAGVAVVVGSGAVLGWQLSRPASAPTMSAALTACHQHSGCRIVQLHGQSGDSAAVLVRAEHATLVPVGMPAAPSGRMYVLWQLPRDGSPIPLLAFRAAGHQTSTVPLVTRYSDTAAFAVSREDAGRMPTRPTDVLAAGAATS